MFIQQQAPLTNVNVDTKSTDGVCTRRVRLQGGGGMSRPVVPVLDTHLAVYSFKGRWVGVKQISLHELWSGTHHSDRLIGVHSLRDTKVLVLYAKTIGEIIRRCILYIVTLNPLKSSKYNSIITHLINKL